MSCLVILLFASYFLLILGNINPGTTLPQLGNERKSTRTDIFESTIIASRDRSDIDFDNDFQQPSEFSFGKDRELFHASIDLKWVLQRLGDKKMWRKIGIRFLETVKRLYPPYDLLYTYRQSALTILKSIYRQDKRSSLRVFQDSIEEAQYLASLINRPILVYVENEKTLGSEDVITPNLETLILRKIFTNHFVEDLINEKFIFFPISSTHPYFQKLLKLAIQQDKVSPTAPLEYPIVITLVPKLSAKDYEHCYRQLKEKENSSLRDVKDLLSHSNPLLFLKRKTSLDIDIVSFYQPNAAELLSSERFYQMLKHLLQEFIIKRREELFFYLESCTNEELLVESESSSASLPHPQHSQPTLLIKQDQHSYHNKDF